MNLYVDLIHILRYNGVTNGGMTMSSNNQRYDNGAQTDSERFIQSRLFKMQDIGYRDFHAKLIPSVSLDSIIGVRTPELRRFAKEIAGSPLAADFSAHLPHKYYEENNLHAFLIERIGDFDRTIAALDEFLPYVDNWATCDTMSPKALSRDLPRLIGKIDEWIADGRTYTVRFAIGMLMRYCLGDSFSPEYLEKVACIESDEYYVNMMIAWYFATALAKQYEAALAYLEQHRLDKWVHNKAIQKACESLRISPEQKTHLRSLKVR
jgi:3-methyladenine DNA glycosylase AlkD